ncbi:D-galacturonic acid reductase [Seiridium cupressi]
MASEKKLVNVLMVGTGEYTTGFVGGGASGSDKKVGVVGLTLFDLRRRGKVGKLSMVGTNGTKFPAIRQHLDTNISKVYNSLDTSFDSFPANDAKDPDAYKAAIDALSPGDAITIFTPDTTHYPIALYAIERGIHVLITKPAVKTLEHHKELIEAAKKKNVFVFIEHHKRFDPAYADARFKAKKLGDFNYFYSYMSQPKSQLETFKAWAGIDSDISYYLNSHHIDICDSMVTQLGYVPIKVSGSGAKGIATSLGCDPITEDTITVLVTWQKKDDPSKIATGVYTASWTAPQKAGVHSNQYFHYMASNGEVRINQAKRGYDVADDSAGQLQWFNPFYMKYAPDEEGNFNGQTGYGYISFEKFVDAVNNLNAGTVSLDELDARGLPTLTNTIATTAILHAGRIAIDEDREKSKQIFTIGIMDSFIDSLPPDVFDQTTLISLASTLAILATAYVGSLAALPSSTSASYRGLFIWHAFDALIHFFLEGSFLYHCFFSWLPLSSIKNPLALAPTAHNYLSYTNRAYGSQAGGDNPFAQLWMVYAKADKRWAGADLTVISLELLTVFVAGPLACLICYGIAKKDPRTNILIIIVATMELYGGFITFCPEWLTHNYNLDTSNFMYKWVYLVFFNMLWVFIPIWAVWVAVKDINDAFEARGKVATAKKAK